MLGILCTGLATAFGAAAQERDMSPTERAGYDAGVDAAVDFCRDLRASPRGTFEAPSFTREFERGCTRGFDDHINSNRTCQRRIQEQNAYTEMREARRYACF
ncbi:MAG: hypothetical protein ACMG6S_12600 [Byssovorax sp.]